MLAAVAPGVTTAQLDAVGPRGARPPRRPPGSADGGVPGRDVRERQRRGRPRHPVDRRGSSARATSSTSTCRPSSTATGPTPAPAPRSAGCRRRPAGSSTPPASPTATPSRRPRRPPLRHIGRAVERRARRHGFSVIENLYGHGTGRNLWEQPSVPGVEDRRDRRCSGRASSWPSSRSSPRRHVGRQAADGWTLYARRPHRPVRAHGRGHPRHAPRHDGDRLLIASAGAGIDISTRPSLQSLVTQLASCD